MFTWESLWEIVNGETTPRKGWAALTERVNAAIREGKTQGQTEENQRMSRMVNPARLAAEHRASAATYRLAESMTKRRASAYHGQTREAGELLGLASELAACAEEEVRAEKRVQFPPAGSGQVLPAPAMTMAAGRFTAQELIDTWEERLGRPIGEAWAHLTIFVNGRVTQLEAAWDTGRRTAELAATEQIDDLRRQVTELTRQNESLAQTVRSSEEKASQAVESRNNTENERRELVRKLQVIIDDENGPSSE